MTEKEKYDKLYRTNAVYPGSKLLYGSLYHAEEVVPYINALKFETVLDLGCGRGQFAKVLAECGKKVTAVDISSELVAQLKKDVVGQTVEFICAPMHQLPVQGPYDLVTAFDVLEHVPESQIVLALKEVYRVAKNNVILSIAWHPCGKPEFNMDLHVTLWPEKRWVKALRNVFTQVVVIARKVDGAFFHVQKIRRG
jgi:ubiquinone/menaquinone biosynthesis C-methylase UbiE